VALLFFDRLMASSNGVVGDAKNAEYGGVAERFKAPVLKTSYLSMRVRNALFYNSFLSIAPAKMACKDLQTATWAGTKGEPLRLALNLRRDGRAV
jgi:hypothetical protein